MWSQPKAKLGYKKGGDGETEEERGMGWGSYLESAEHEMK